jgi:hypothetical protein
VRPRVAQDTSRQGRYHNIRFRDLATELGIRVERDPRIGWSITTVPDTTAQHYGDQIAALDTAIKAHRLADVHGAGRTTSNNGLVATCECEPPRKIRLSRTAYDAGAITCGACEADFTARDTDSSTDTARDGRSHALDATPHINAAHGKGNHLMDDEPVRRHTATEQQRPDDVRAADHGDDHESRTDSGHRPCDSAMRHEASLRVAAEQPRLHRHNMTMNPPAVDSTLFERDSTSRVADDDHASDFAVEDGDRTRDDPVQRARIAVDQLVTREREIGQQRAEATRTEQVNRWQHDDSSSSHAARASLADDRADGGGVAR